MFFEIVIKGHINDNWFDDLKKTRQQDYTTKLSGELVDQAALYGVLRQINDLGIELISVQQKL